MKIKSILYLMLSVAFALTSCRSECETRAIGWITVFNNTENQQQVTIFQLKKNDVERKPYVPNIVLSSGEIVTVQVELRRKTYDVFSIDENRILDERLFVQYCDTTLYEITQ